MPKILVVEDEKGLSDSLREALNDELHRVDVIPDGKQALACLGTIEYDLIVLDLMLPGMDGMELCRQFRAAGGKTPVLIISARSSVESRAGGLDAGADDYLTKPFDLTELSARVRALLRRGSTPPVAFFQLGNLHFDRTSLQVKKDGNEIHLLPKELRVLELLMRHSNHVVTIDTLLDNIWGSDSSVSPDTVRTYIKTLRRKIDSVGQQSLIRTIHGVGYRMEAPGTVKTLFARPHQTLNVAAGG